MKKKHFAEFLRNSEKGGQSEAPSFSLSGFGNKLKVMEMDIEAEMKKLNKRKNQGVASHKVEKVSNSEIGHMSKVLNHSEFQKDPFAAIKQHLLNSVSNQE